MPGLFQRGAEARGAAVLPDNRIVKRLAGGPVPEQGGLALIGDADGGDILRADTGALDRGAGGAGDGGPEIGGIMFDPARSRVVLGEFLLRRGNRLQRLIEEDCPRRSRPLIYGKNMGHRSGFLDCGRKAGT